MLTENRAELGIIGGTGMEGLLVGGRDIAVETPFGDVPLRAGHVGGAPAAMLLRHGPGHARLPHEVNYRGNLWALHSFGVRRVLATVACGALSLDLAAGRLALLDDFIDLTRARIQTFRGTAGLPADAGFFHVDLLPPYCPHLSLLLASAAEARGGPPLPAATYACVDGPRFESPAEVRMLALLGATVVGMTGLPEAVLARELGMCYASLAIVTNPAAGLSEAALDHEDVERRGALLTGEVAALIEAAAARLHPAPERCCPAADRRRRWFGE
jgi:5'-methylthioadenosine phosphorylase